MLWPRSSRWVAKLCRSPCSVTRFLIPAASAALWNSRFSWRVLVGSLYAALHRMEFGRGARSAPLRLTSAAPNGPIAAVRHGRCNLSLQDAVTALKVFGTAQFCPAPVGV